MLFNNKSLYKNINEKYIKSNYIIYAFRYFSLFITCIFYSSFSAHNPLKKLLIVILITSATILLNILYLNCNDNKLHTIIILVVETACVSAIIILSGGFKSPFIWYIFNTILFSLVLLNNFLFSQMCLLIYIISIFISDIYILYPYGKITIEPECCNTVLCLVLITILIQILVKNYFNIMAKNTELNKKNEEINTVNLQIKESMQYIMNLYNTVHIFSIQNNKKDIINQIINYSTRILHNKHVCFIESMVTNKNQKVYYCSADHISNDIDNYINTNYDTICTSNKITVMQINGISYGIYPVKHKCTVYGLLLFELDVKISIEKNSMIFISELSSILFNKFELEEINNKFIISEEQNRIANEIHDGVLQRMFNISCCTFNLTKKFEDYSKEQILNDLNTINYSIKSAMKDLRKTIYELSINKYAANVFLDNIKNYIEEVSNLNNVKIHFDFFGDSETLPLIYKKTIYRIICESISNAIRHGNSQDISLTLTTTNIDVTLVINDNGIGFNYNETIKQQKHGLGLLNIQHLVNSFNGECSINSILNKGTSIYITLPYKG